MGKLGKSYIWVVIDLRNKKIISRHRSQETSLNKARSLNKKYKVRYFYNTRIKK